MPRPRKNAPRAVAKAVQDAARLRGQIEGYQARADEYHPDDLAGIMRGLRAKLAAAQARIVKDAGRPASQALIESGDILAGWNALAPAGRRAVVKEQVEHITIGPATTARGAGPPPCTTSPSSGAED